MSIQDLHPQLKLILDRFGQWGTDVHLVVISYLTLTDFQYMFSPQRFSVKDISYYAATNNDLTLLARSFRHNHLNPVLKAAARFGHIRVLDWVALQRHHAHVFSPKTFNLLSKLAAENGHLQVLEYLHNRQPRGFLVECILIAMRSQHKHIFTYLLQQENAFEYSMTKVMQKVNLCHHAAKLKDPSYLQSLRQRGARWDDRTMEYAAKFANWETLKWAYENGAPLNHRYPTRLANLIVARGDMEVIQWLFTTRISISENIMDMAVLNGHLEIMNFILNHPSRRYGFTPYSAGNAVHHPHAIQLLEWLFAHHAPLTTETAYMATSASLKILQWLRAHGCPWNELTCDLAYMRNNLPMLKWAVNHGCPFDAKIRQVAELKGFASVQAWIDSIPDTMAQNEN